MKCITTGKESMKKKTTSNVVIKLLNKYNKCEVLRKEFSLQFLKTSSRVMNDKGPLGKDSSSCSLCIFSVGCVSRLIYNCMCWRLMHGHASIANLPFFPHSEKFNALFRQVSCTMGKTTFSNTAIENCYSRFIDCSFPSGFTYFARDPKYSWFHDPSKNQIHFLNKPEKLYHFQAF